MDFQALNNMHGTSQTRTYINIHIYTNSSNKCRNDF